MPWPLAFTGIIPYRKSGGLSIEGHRAEMPWIVARTKPNQEWIAAHNVRNQDMQCYLPVYYDDREKRRRVLFPSYLFIEIVDRFSHLMSTRGITRLITLADGRPAPLPAAVIDDLRSRENQNGVIVLDRAVDGLKKGDPVAVRYGAFGGERAIYQGQAPKDRVRVLLTMLGTMREVVLPHGAIEAAG